MEEPVGSYRESFRLRLQYSAIRVRLVGRNASEAGCNVRFLILEAQLQFYIYQETIIYIYERQSLPDAMHVGYINLAAKNGAAKTIGDSAKMRAHNKKRTDWPEGRNKIST